MLRHVLGSSALLRAAAEGTERAAPEPRQLPADWRDRTWTAIAGLSRAWSLPEAWEGNGRWINGMLPNRLLGTMALTELLVHGWDLAMATGQHHEVPKELAMTLCQLADRLGPRPVCSRLRSRSMSTRHRSN